MAEETKKKSTPDESPFNWISFGMSLGTALVNGIVAGAGVAIGTHLVNRAFQVNAQPRSDELAGTNVVPLKKHG